MFLKYEKLRRAEKRMLIFSTLGRLFKWQENGAKRKSGKQC